MSLYRPYGEKDEVKEVGDKVGRGATECLSKKREKRLDFALSHGLRANPANSGEFRQISAQHRSRKFQRKSS